MRNRPRQVGPCFRSPAMMATWPSWSNLSTSREGREARRASTIVASFYQGDGKTAFEPTPTEVSVKIGVAEVSPSVTLAPSPGKAVLTSRFASPQGDYPEGLQGVVSAKINGLLIEVPISAR